jgi:hypothetical protein
MIFDSARISKKKKNIYFCISQKQLFDRDFFTGEEEEEEEKTAELTLKLHSLRKVKKCFKMIYNFLHFLEICSLLKRFVKVDHSQKVTAVLK